MNKPSIVAVLRGLKGFLELDDSVHGWKAIQCPFHDDRAASASYSTTLERFRCHGCGISGDGYDLIQEVESCDFATAKARATVICGRSFHAINLDSSPVRSKLTQRRTSQRAKLIRQKYGNRSR